MANVTSRHWPITEVVKTDGSAIINVESRRADGVQRQCACVLGTIPLFPKLLKD